MKESFIFEGKKYISARRASEIFKYAPDYVGQLCRANKVDCRMVGRSWFVTEESLHLHKASISREDASRNRIDNLRGKKLVNVPTFIDKNISSKVEKNVPDLLSEEVKKAYSKPLLLSSNNSSGSIIIQGPVKDFVVSDKISQPVKYDVDQGPLLPILKNKSVVSNENKLNLNKSNNLSTKLSKDIEAFLNISSKKELPEKIETNQPVELQKVDEAVHVPVVVIKENLNKKNISAYSKIAREVILKRVLMPVLILFMFFGLGTGTYIIGGKVGQSISPQITRSTQVAVANISDVASTVYSMFASGYKNVVAFFTSPARLALDINTPKEVFNVSISDVTPNGLVLTSSSGSNVADEIVKQKIKESFSDDVEINPDKSGTTGVITPVFKNTDGKDFVYVMVPVKDKEKTQIP